jgi:hypothetical protein
MKEQANVAGTPAARIADAQSERQFLSSAVLNSMSSSPCGGDRWLEESRFGHG